jgi:formate dehydrogenase
LELLVCVDMVQRESHRHADWLIPGTHWLERDELVDPIFGTLTELPFVQFTPKALSPPPTVREEWMFYEDLGAAMGLAGFGTVDPTAFEVRWRDVVDGGGRTSWAEVKASPHGILLGDREFGHGRQMINTPGHQIRLAPARFLDEVRRQLSAGSDAAIDRDVPYYLGNRRRPASMNSHLNDLPSIRRMVDSNCVEVHEDDAAELGLQAGDRARVSSASASIVLDVVISTNPRPGTVVIEHGWGSRVFDPLNGGAPDVLGVNRNVLTPVAQEDPLSFMSGFNDTRVAVERVDQRDG